MDAIEQFKREVQAGRIDVDQLVALVVKLQQQLATAQQQLATAQQRIEEYEKKSNGIPTTKVDEPYSMRAEEKRQEARGKKTRKSKRKGRRGRLCTADKIARAERTEKVYPPDLPPSECRLSHTRPVWRLENGRAVLIAYDIYRGPGNVYGQIPGVLGRSEFGLEIVTTIAHMVYEVGLSFDKVCQLLQFFQHLHLKKSQVDALLNQLARHWEHEFEVLCTLLANSLVVHADETRWSLNSVWALLSEKARVVLFGVHKDAATLQTLLDPETFAGIVISDHAAVYGKFTRTQKCWAHLLRKAIKLTLQEPENAEYRGLTDGLLEIYQEACRSQRDGRLSDAGRQERVTALTNTLFELIKNPCFAPRPPSEGAANEYRLLVNELMRLLLDHELFTFVTAAPVEQVDGTTAAVAGTNNESERTLRNPAQARQTGRTNKTINGARRQTIVMSVLESLRLYLPTYTLSSVVAEIARWWQAGRSCFTDQLNKLKLGVPEDRVLDQVLPIPTG
jgi:transposase